MEAFHSTLWHRVISFFWKRVVEAKLSVQTLSAQTKCLEIYLFPAQIQTTLCWRQSQNITLWAPSMLHFRFRVSCFVCFFIGCDMSCQKIIVLGILPRHLVACQYAFWQITVSLFTVYYQQWCPLCLFSLPPFWFKQWPSDTDVDWPWCSLLISLEVVLVSFVIIHIIHHLDFSTNFLLQPR